MASSWVFRSPPGILVTPSEPARHAGRPPVDPAPSERAPSPETNRRQGRGRRGRWRRSPSADKARAVVGRARALPGGICRNPLLRAIQRPRMRMARSGAARGVGVTEGTEGVGGRRQPGHRSRDTSGSRPRGPPPQPGCWRRGCRRGARTRDDVRPSSATGTPWRSNRSAASASQRAHHGHPASAQALLGGGQGDAQLISGFGHGPPLDVVQDHHRPIRVRQAREGVEQVLTALGGGDRVGHVHRVGVISPGPRPPRRPRRPSRSGRRARSMAARMRRSQLSSDASPQEAMAPAAVGAQDRLLHQVLHVGRRLGVNTDSKPHQHGRVPEHPGRPFLGIIGHGDSLVPRWGHAGTGHEALESSGQVLTPTNR